MGRFGLKNLNILEVKTTGDLVKDRDKADLDINYYTNALGLRASGNNFISERDFGTVNRFTVPPIRPNAFIVINGVDTQSGLTKITTASAHGYSNGDTVYIDEMYPYAYNGKFTISNVASTSFTLVGTTGESAGSTAGIVTKTPCSIIGGTTFYDNTTQVEYEIIVALDSSNMTRIYVYDETASAGLRWTELTRKFNAQINEGSGIGATDRTFDIDNILENGVTFTFVDDIVNNWIVVNTSKSNQTVLITDSSAANLIVDTIVGSSGLGWANNDNLEIYRFPAMKFNYEYDNGTSPLFDWQNVEQKRKTTMLYSNSASPRVYRQPLQIMRKAARNYFYSTYGGSAAITLDAGWYIESDFGVQNPFFLNEGSVDNPETTTVTQKIITAATAASPIVCTCNSHGYANDSIVAINGALGITGMNGTWVVKNVTVNTFELYGSTGVGTYTGSSASVAQATENSIYDKTSGRNWMSLCLAKMDAVTGNRNLRFYLTLVYDDATESDPIYQGFYRAPTVSYVLAQLLVNFALMNKSVTAVNIYAASANETIYSAGWDDAASEYYLCKTYKFQSDSSAGIAYGYQNNNWSVNRYRAKAYNFYESLELGFNSPLTDTAARMEQPSINSALNHAVDKNRSYPTPKFIAKGTREQGSIVVINEGDTKLHLSLYDGYGNHQDDNIPDVATDNNGNKMLIELFGTSEILGLEVLYDTIFVFRNNLIETFDLQGVAKRTYVADIVAYRSITLTPYGIVYAGRSAIYIVPSDGSEIRVLNLYYDSYYGGNEYVTGTTQYITDAYRSAIVGGYDETYRQVWMLCQVNTAASSEYILFRYSFDVEKWTERRINTANSIKYFTKRQNDGTFTIATNRGLLKYPNRSGSYIYEDDVLLMGDASQKSQDLPVPTSFTLNIGAFNNAVNEKVLHGFVFEMTGESTDGSGSLLVELFANDEAVAFDSQYIRVDQRMEYRQVARRGNIERLAFKVTVPEDTNLKGSQIRKITLGFVGDTKIGNL